MGRENPPEKITGIVQHQVFVHRQHWVEETEKKNSRKNTNSLFVLEKSNVSAASWAYVYIELQPALPRQANYWAAKIYAGISDGMKPELCRVTKENKQDKQTNKKISFLCRLIVSSFRKSLYISWGKEKNTPKPFSLRPHPFPHTIFPIGRKKTRKSIVCPTV